MDLEHGGTRLRNLSNINVLMGKNGVGKSNLLRQFDEHCRGLPDTGAVKYITPERGGRPAYDGGIDTNLQTGNWGPSQRRQNQTSNFRQMSVDEFRRLETLVLREIEKVEEKRNDPNFTFDNTINLINALLDKVEIFRGDDAGFTTRHRGDGNKIPDTRILSSGESELISLAIEILSFAHQAKAEPNTQKTSYLFIDEPDVHLHPDLQFRLMQLLSSAVADTNIITVIATHSTAILSALSDREDTTVGFMEFGAQEVEFRPIADSLRRVLPIFGAHPLSNVFNESPILLVEGADDEWIWQQAVRSSEKRLNVWPCAAGDKQSLDAYENQVEAIAGAIYDDATAYSLRDRDDGPYDIEDKAIVIRMRLFCREAENLILSDDVLNSLNTSWDEMQAAIDDWLLKYPVHPQRDAMQAFRDNGSDRRGADVKPLCNVFMMLAGSKKPWQVAVGQTIAGLLDHPPLEGDQSLSAYLGPKLVKSLSLWQR